MRLERCFFPGNLAYSSRLFCVDARLKSLPGLHAPGLFYYARGNCNLNARGSIVVVISMPGHISYCPGECR